MKGRVLDRKDFEQPFVVGELGWRYHHVGIPTKRKHPGERYLAEFKMYVSGFEASPYGIEWMRFERDSPLPELIRTVPHVAFEVMDLDREIQGKEVLWPPGVPSDGVRAAMILDNGAPVELISFGKSNQRLGPGVGDR